MNAKYKIQHTPIIERLVRRSHFDLSTGCWLWDGALNDGYGIIKILGKTYRVHRVAASELFNFSLSSPLQILHSCDRPRCWAPEHLRPGTNYDNIVDMLQKGKKLFGKISWE
jgi:hypothetical protein